jgi:DNA-binding protein YbaB
VAQSADRDANQALRARLDEVRGEYEQLRGGLTELGQRLATLRVTAESPDGLIRATVGPRGQLVDLRIDHRGYHTVDADELSHAILATVRAAVADTTAQVRELVGGCLPAGSGDPVFLDDDLGDLLRGTDDA